MRRTLTALAVCLLILTACAKPPEPGKFTLFYPPPPELPRFQWLTSFTGSKDIEPEKSEFDVFITGEEAGRRLDKPYGIAFWKGKIYVCDTNRTVMVFDLDNRTFSPLTGAVGPGKLLQPLNISIDKDGNKYITDSVRQQVVIFDATDHYIRAIGHAGLWRPTDATVFEDKLYVTDMKNKEVVVFDRTGETALKRFGQSGEERLGLPTNLAVDVNGVVYVSDAGRFQVVKFDRDGHFIGAVGRLGDSASAFARPKGVALDSNRNLYVVDAAFDNVQVFNSKGHLLLWFGHFGEFGRLPGEFYLPAKVIVDYDHVKYFQKFADPAFEIEYLVLVTSQFGERLVNVFGYGKQKGKKYPTEDEIVKMIEQRKQREVEEMRKAGEKEEDLSKEP